MRYMGIDVGSVSTNFVLIDEYMNVEEQLYLKTGGDPLKAVKEGLKQLGANWSVGHIGGVGTTGSGRALAGAVVGSDVVKNEITCHAVAAAAIDPEIRTVLEIGGQDSKIILLKDGIISDFAMNTVCAAGTGSFLDRQAERLGIRVDQLGEYAVKAKSPAKIAGRCAVFAESDIIHKQQMGCKSEDIIAGMSAAMVRNYLSNVAKGKRIEGKICFQGGVAANLGIKKAFEEALDTEIIVPRYHKVMGAYGAAIMAKEKMEVASELTSFHGFITGRKNIEVATFHCHDCGNQCEVTVLSSEGERLGCFSDRCGKHQNSLTSRLYNI
ncbi:MAG: acyl-CoA dehydratase activase [Anaerovoracaceae bacterium]|jgi:predicted CoA-substrate-specific enzyme activase